MLTKEEKRKRKYDYNKKWKLENPEKLLAQNRAWRKANPDKVIRARKKYRKNNPDQGAEYMRNKRSKETPEEYEERKRVANATYWRNPARAAENHRVYYKKNRKKLRAYNKEYLKNHKEEMYAVRREKTANDPNYRRAQKNRELKLYYGITIEDYDRMVKEQKGLCAICHKKPGGKRKVLVVDHNHITGKVRDLLCHPCNVGAGHFKDSASLIRQAADYMDFHEAKAKKENKNAKVK